MDSCHDEPVCGGWGEGGGEGGGDRGKEGEKEGRREEWEGRERASCKLRAFKVAIWVNLLAHSFNAFAVHLVVGLSSSEEESSIKLLVDQQVGEVDLAEWRERGEREGGEGEGRKGGGGWVRKSIMT